MFNSHIVVLHYQGNKKQEINDLKGKGAQLSRTLETVRTKVAGTL